jgi:hypothetical protein
MVFIIFVLLLSSCSQTTQYDIDFDAKYWQPEIKRLTAIGCDMTSEKVNEYRQCLLNDMIDAYDAAGIVAKFDLYRDGCRGFQRQIPECIVFPDTGKTTYSCDVSRLEEGWYNDEICPLGHSIELVIIIDWYMKSFTYDLRWTCKDDRLGVAYDYIRTEMGSTEGGGDLTVNFWLFGQYQATTTYSYECGPPRYCGNTGSPPEQETYYSSKYIVGRLASTSHLEMGEQNQSYPLDAETLIGIYSWAELEGIYRGSKLFDCYSGD